MTTDYQLRAIDALAEIPVDADAEIREYPDPWNSIMERLAQADPDTLRKLANWGTGDAPN